MTRFVPENSVTATKDAHFLLDGCAALVAPSPDTFSRSAAHPQEEPTMKRFALVLALLIVTAGPAVAGIVDTPLPPGTNYLFSVPGVTNAAGLGTYFTCTSTSADPQTVTVEAFDPGGNLSGTASAVVNAGQSARFGTQPAASIGLLANNLGSGVILVGSARILSTAKGKLLCTAVVADATNAIPNSMVYLSIIAKTKQKAAN